MARASARHILVKTEEACVDLKNKIQEGADFGEMAKEHSECPLWKRRWWSRRVQSRPNGTRV